MRTLARDNDAAGVEALLRRGAPAGYQNRVGQTPLHIAAMWGSIEAAKVLLEARADPNTPNRLRGSTPLHAAALGRGVAEKRSFCARLMIQAKGDPRRGDFEGELPMDMATDEVVRVALGAAPLLLHKAVELRQLKALSEALEQITSGAVDLTLETQNPRGESALFAARAWPEGLKVLLEARCDVNTTNHARRSPLHVAVLAGDLRTTQLLLDAKADVTIKDMDIDRDPRYISKNQQETPAEHRTALHHAAALGNPLLVKLLLQARASVDAVDSQQMTAPPGERIFQQTALFLGFGCAV
ncbi:unnamed protein product [Effrenium voratum]|uniref:Uncharacterized protein n=1 Tax=Effrenium voratum TaxID=2562239 RepID=A0AA36I3B4_9DINO|nr:unnamed protein product [Effrenium voratum]